MLERVSIDEDLSDVLGLDHLVFYLVWCDILALRELEDVLLSVYDLKSTAWKELTNVTSVDPAVSINGISGLLRLSEVPLKSIVALVADLSTWHRNSIFILILASVGHFWDINEFNVESRVRSSDMATGGILGPGDCSWSTALGLSVALVNLAAEGDLQELEDLLRDGS